jgi:hypothetical protein
VGDVVGAVALCTVVGAADAVVVGSAVRDGSVTGIVVAVVVSTLTRGVH